MAVEQGGATANRQGKLLEGQVEQVLLSRGYTKLTDDEKRSLVRQDGALFTGDDKWFCSQIALRRNLYGARWKLDFYVYNTDKFPEGLYIESKWQSSSGSVDEKYVFTVLSLLDFPGDKVVVIDGGGARQGAIEWMKSRVTKRNRLHVFASLGEFIHWANKSL